MKAFIRIYQALFSIPMGLLNFREPKVVTGPGSLNKLPEILQKNNYKKPLVVTDSFLATTDWFKAMCDSLDDYVLFGEVTSDPTIDLIEKIDDIYRNNSCDCIVAVGGGSSIDAAKACGAKIVRPNKTLQQLGGTMKVRKKLPFMVAIPTTAGTGSECTVAAVVTDAESHRKYAINDPCLTPALTIHDANLTLSLPKGMTSTTGMDAMTHAVEAYLNKAYQRKFIPDMCISAIKTINENILTAYNEPDNVEARQAMLRAAYEAGRVFTIACVGNVHAAAHTMGGLYHIPHGLANAVTLPIVLEDYGEKVYKDLSYISRAIGLSEEADSDETAAKAFITRIKELNAAMNIPEHLEGLKEEDFDQMAAFAVKEANPLYPVPVIYDKERFKKIFRTVGNI